MISIRAVEMSSDEEPLVRNVVPRLVTSSLETVHASQSDLGYVSVQHSVDVPLVSTSFGGISMEPAPTERDPASADHDGQCSSIGICDGVPSTVPAQSPILTWVDDVFQEPCATRRDTDSVSVGLADHGSRGHENDFSSLLDGLEEDLGVSRVVDPVPSPRHMPRRSGRRVVLVPGSPDATQQSIQNRFLVDESSLTDAVSTGEANLQFRQGGCPVTLQNRFDPLIHNADSAPALSRPEEFAMTEASCTESQEFRPTQLEAQIGVEPCSTG